MTCDHCECIQRGHPCCHCGAWLKDIPPVEVTDTLVTCNPIAMVHEQRYPFIFMGLRWFAVRHNNEAVEMVRVIGYEEDRG